MIKVPLRAFLMVRSDDGTWTVTVCHDLSNVMRTWKARKEPDRNMAVLHIGFDRPPSQIFDAISIRHPGRMLLTAAAKYALPSSFIASIAPVAIAEGTEVFIGLQGWGYFLEDPTTPENRSEPTPAANLVPQKPKDWVVPFLEEHSTAAEILSEHEIYDDASYLEKESELERSARHRIGLFRAHHLIGTNCDDPCKLACAAPPWLAERELVTLDLSERARNVLRAASIKTVRDLADWSTEMLLNQPNFGRKSFSNTFRALSAALKEGPLRAATINDTNKESQLLTEVHRSLLSLSDREREVLTRRLGLETKHETLQQIADALGITRERVRQIETHTIQKWIRISYWNDILEQKITRMLIGTSFPLPIAGVEVIDPWFEGVSSHQDFFKNLVRAVCNDHINLVYIDDIYYFSLIGQETWERTVSDAKGLLSSGPGQKWSKDYVRSLVQNLLPDTSKEFGPLLWDMSSHLCHFSKSPDGSHIFTSYGRGADHVVEAILAESDTPLHYEEIAKRAKLRTGKSLDTRRAHSAAANVGLLFARGTYGLARHVPLSEEQMLRIRTEAENIVSSGTPGKQWHTSEIFLELSERLDSGFDRLDKYVLDIALTESNILHSLQKMIWAESGKNTNKQPRIDIHQAIVAIVKKAGHPLSTSDIREQLTAVRGLNEFFQIHPTDPLICLRSGLWGINDRDVPLSREEQRKLIEDLIGELKARQDRIHASELASILTLRDCPPDAFLSIAAQDDRLKRAKQYVYLKKAAQ